MNRDTPEFALIDRHFTRATRRADVVLGVGDDGALLQPPARSWLVLTTDTMVCGTHFLPTDKPEALGHKLVAVNLSDLAAMGADPAWLTLALTLPKIDHDWLAAFASGLFGLADAVGVELVGGDVTRGPLTLTLQAAGTVPEGMLVYELHVMPGNGEHAADPGTRGDRGFPELQHHACRAAGLAQGFANFIDMGFVGDFHGDHPDAVLA